MASLTRSTAAASAIVRSAVGRNSTVPTIAELTKEEVAQRYTDFQEMVKV